MVLVAGKYLYEYTSSIYFFPLIFIVIFQVTDPGIIKPVVIHKGILWKT